LRERKKTLWLSLSAELPQIFVNCMNTLPFDANSGLPVDHPSMTPLGQGLPLQLPEWKAFSRSIANRIPSATAAV
jgi:hypothetical protein